MHTEVCKFIIVKTEIQLKKANIYLNSIKSIEKVSKELLSIKLRLYIKLKIKSVKMFQKIVIQRGWTLIFLYTLIAIFDKLILNSFYDNYFFILFIRDSFNKMEQPTPEEINSNHQSQEEDLQNKYKTKPIQIKSNQEVDITSKALEKYSQLKKNYGFVTFEDNNKQKKFQVGTLTPVAVPEFEFNEAYISFQKNGYCPNPNQNIKGLVFNQHIHPQFKKLNDVYGEQINEDHPDFIQKMFYKTSKKLKLQKTKQIKAKRDKDQRVKYSAPWAGYGENLINGDLTQQQKLALIHAEEKRRIRIEQAKKQQQNFQPFSTFHWKQHFDYKGQSYVQPPSDYKFKYGNCYIPKGSTYTWVGSNTQGYQVARFFPKVGHFILSGNAQGQVKLFDVLKDKSCARTYVGHTKAIRDLAFSSDGKHFLSCSFDKSIHYWDTQYGKVLRTFKLKKYPFCVKFNPDFQKQNIFLVGSSSKKISQFDLNSGTRTLQYDQHLGTVNTITFIQPRKFVSSSDDKKLFVWQFGIPVVYKHVSQPQMHAVTSATMHPNGQYYAGQSSDNQVVIYQSKGGNFRRNRAKKFASHNCAGYACGISFSNDGQFLASGDERGRLFFYDWKTAKNYRTLDAHSGVCIGVQWHPCQPTKVLTCGWQGLIKLWQ